MFIVADCIVIDRQIYFLSQIWSLKFGSWASALILTFWPRPQ